MKLVRDLPNQALNVSVEERPALFARITNLLNDPGKKCSHLFVQIYIFQKHDCDWKMEKGLSNVEWLKLLQI